MFQCAIKQDGIELEQKLFIPENAKEMSYGMYLDYVFMQAQMAEWITSQMKLKKNFEYQYKVKLAKCIGIVLGINYDIISQMKYKELQALEVLWGMIEKVIQEFKPIDNGGRFYVGDFAYKIPEITKVYFIGSNNLPEISVQQLEQIGNAEDKLQNAIAAIDATDKNQKEPKGDAIARGLKKAQLTFNHTLKKIALCATPISKIPTDSSFDIWIEQQSRVLTKISMYDALNTLFFLIGLPKDYEFLIGLSSISTLLRSENAPKNLQKYLMNEEVN